jgi:predicted Ser/Thr protein kinase/c-di-GMP-binding flagellar brake protein YcgR
VLEPTTQPPDIELPLESAAYCAVIKIVKGPATGRLVKLLPGQTLSFGRADENDVVIEDLDVSRHHCTFANAQGRVVLTDLQSSNGTFIAGKRITKAILDGRTLITLGSFGTKLSFDYQSLVEVSEEATEETAAEVPEERLRLAQRRSKSRTPCRIAVWCNTEDQAFPGTVTDIGTGGLALQTEVELKQGDLVEVRPRENRYAAIRLAVRWRNAAAVPLRYGTCFAEDLDSLRTSWVSDALRALGRDARTAQERRTDIRVKAVISCQFEAHQEIYKLQSANLGATGVCLEGARMPELGQQLSLLLGDTTVSGRVVWLQSQRCGVAFEDLDEAQKSAVDAMVRSWMAPEAPFPLGTPPSTGDSLGHYQLGPLLGEGGFGRVYRAYDTRLMRDVAIKVLVGDSITPQSLERFLIEARSVARVSHPAVVTIFEIATGPRYYIVMELIHGEPLSQLLSRATITPARAIYLIRQVLDALQVVHDAGVIHRDLNTANIMVCANDKVKVFDFGLAKFADQATTVSQAGQVWGTPQYMAPEQIDSRSGPIDHQTDLFTAASVFYEMLTGRPAFQAPSIPKLIYEILYNDPPDPRTINPHLPEPLVDVLLKGLCKAKEERHQSCRDFIRELDKLANP